MTSAKTGNYRKIALASVTGAIGLLYIGIFAGVDVSPTPAGFGTDIPAMTPKEIAATKKKPVYRRGPEVVALNQYFKSIGYSFGSMTEVPRVYIKRVPKGLGHGWDYDESLGHPVVLLDAQVHVAACPGAPPRAGQGIVHLNGALAARRHSQKDAER